MTKFIMKEYVNNETIYTPPNQRGFKVKIGTGTASIQMQADDEGFDEITDGGFTATGFGTINLPGSTLKIVLTGDARFFMAVSG